jgi:hypothetical protein
MVARGGSHDNLQALVLYPRRPVVLFRLPLVTYFRSMPRKILSFEESSALSEITTVGGGVGVDGMETLELAVEGAGDARSVVEPEEAYAMAELVQESGQTKDGG